MTSKTLFLDDELYAYMLGMSRGIPPVQRALLDVTAEMEWAGIESSPEQVQLLRLLVQAIDARRCLEIGVFTGYSTLVIASALPADARIVACDIDQESTAVAREFWERAGVAPKIDLRIAPAVTTLKNLIADGLSGSFDFAYIDADKGNGAAYYELVLLLLRGNGLMAIDNVFWGGLAARGADGDRDTRAVRALNEIISRDRRVDVSVIPLGDGMLLARKRPVAGSAGGQS